MFRALPVTGRRLAFATAAAGAVGSYYLLSRPTQLEATPITKRRPGPLWAPMTREGMLEHLRTSGVFINRTPDGGPEPGIAQKGYEAKPGDDVFDLIIVGGGATGAGTVLDAATRGLKVAMVERDDFASGTSSKSTKLVHGGVRYLQKAIMELDYEQWKLVKEALRERRVFLETAPHLSHMLPILLPIYTWWQLPYYYAGCKLYDILAGKENMVSSYAVGKKRAIEGFPMLKTDGLVGGVVYYDGQHNDSRMNIGLVCTAVQHGAIVANQCEVVGIQKTPDAARGGDERISSVTLRDNLTGEEFTVKTRGVINATGPFTDGMRKLDNPATPEICAPAAGVHITLPNYYGTKTMGLLDPATSDGRVIFFLPWQGNIIAGTTDSPSNISQNPVPSESEIQWILDEVRNYLSPDVKVRRGDVLSAWSGIRPLVRDPNAKNTESLVRNHIIDISPSGLITIAGGKWTTYRAMAQETVDAAVKEFNLKPNGPCQTEHIKLIGAHGWSETMYIKLIQQFGLETDVAKHLSECYGDRAWTVAMMEPPTGLSWPLYGTRLSPLYPYLEAEARYACRHEFAVKATDFIARRTRIAFNNVQVTLEALPRIIDIMAEELGWDKKRKHAEFDEAFQFLKSFGIPENAPKITYEDVVRKKGNIGIIAPKEEVAIYARSAFSPKEIQHLTNLFHELDFDSDGRITKEDLVHAMSKMGYEQSLVQADRILAEVDYNRKGAIDYQDFLDIAAGLKEVELSSAFTHLAQMADDYTKRTKIPVERSGGGA